MLGSGPSVLNINGGGYGSRLKAGTTIVEFVIASEATQSIAAKERWIASSLRSSQ
jgi:hypothetical protein